jgi:putative ABC transport system substrate-binding protein
VVVGMGAKPMRRRHFITLLGSAAAAWPLATRAQQQTMPVIGFLSVGSLESNAVRLTGLRRGLNESGYVEGRDFVFEYRDWAGNQADLPAMAAELIHIPATVIVTIGVFATLAVKTATTSIPILFIVAADPVQLGLVASLNRPGGNLTGFNALTGELGGKGLALLHELVPSAATFGFLETPEQSDIRANDERRAGDGFGHGAKGSDIQSGHRSRNRCCLREPSPSTNRGAARR